MGIVWFASLIDNVLAVRSATQLLKGRTEIMSVGHGVRTTSHIFVVAILLRDEAVNVRAVLPLPFDHGPVNNL